MKTHRGKLIVILVFLLVLLADSLSRTTETDAAQNVPRTRCVRGTFPSSTDEKPSDWSGPVFSLSQDYPDTVPPDVYPWKGIDYKIEPMRYLMAVRQYVYEGNLSDDPNKPWEIQNNPKRKWYHAPWLHTGKNRREFIHGLTRELPSEPGQLWDNPPQTDSIQNWAVGFYNAPGAKVIGEMWCDPNKPDLGGVRFPEDTVSAKLLFSAAPLSQVPFLKGSVEWLANIYTDPYNTETQRRPQIVRLLQLDVAIRDVNNTKTGWVFGTFIYNPEGGSRNPWENMQPVGLMWGNDEGVTPTNGGKIEESRFNPGIDHLMKHYGWARRLNGPIDNPLSSCLSCHSTAGWPPAALTPPKGSTDNVRLHWFRNIKAGEPFSKGQVSFDYSLQLSAGIVNFMKAHPKLLALQPSPIRKSLSRPWPIVNRAGKHEAQYRRETLNELKRLKRRR